MQKFKLFKNILVYSLLSIGLIGSANAGLDGQIITAQYAYKNIYSWPPSETIITAGNALISPGSTSSIHLFSAHPGFDLQISNSNIRIDNSSSSTFVFNQDFRFIISGDVNSRSTIDGVRYLGNLSYPPGWSVYTPEFVFDDHSISIKPGAYIDMAPNSFLDFQITFKEINVAIPEPGSLAMILTGLCLVGLAGRRQPNARTT